MTVPTTATAPTSTSPLPRRLAFQRGPARPGHHDHGLALTHHHGAQPGEFYDILIQPVMFTVLFGELFGGAIAGDVKAYLPTIVPGLIIMNALTTSQSVGVDLREDMDKASSTASAPCRCPVSRRSWGPWSPTCCATSSAPR